MQEFRYVIVGGGMAAAAAVQGIRSRDGDGEIALFSADRYPPYSRPPLSKGLWRGKRLETIWRYQDPEGLRLAEHLGVRVAEIRPEEHLIRLADDRAFGYERLLLATGGEPRRLPGDPPGVTYLRDLDDYLRIFRAKGARGVVLGGGFVGAEMACALRLAEKEVEVVVPEAGLLAAVLPADLSRAVTEDYRSRGVKVHAGTSVEQVEERRGLLAVQLSGGGAVEADFAVAGLGIRPRTELAERAGIEVQDGIVVDRYGRTSAPDVYAAGDAARIPVAALGQSIRVEHEDNAVQRGRLTGANMAGAKTAMDEAPFFYSDLFDLGFEAVGILDSRLETHADWAEPYRRGVVYYLDGGRVCGVLNWNVWGQVPAARALLGSRCEDPASLDGRIPTD